MLFLLVKHKRRYDIIVRKETIVIVSLIEISIKGFDLISLIVYAEVIVSNYCLAFLHLSKKLLVFKPSNS